MMNKFCVYTHTAIGESVPFYVGKGYKKRAYDKTNRSKYWHNVAKNGYTIEYEFEGLDDQTAMQIEKDMIKMWGRRITNTGCLVNLTDGGDGSSGYVPDDVWRDKISKRMLEQWKTNPQHRKNVADALCKYEYTITHKTGQTYTATNLHAFCKEHNLSTGHMSSVVQGKRKQHKGWTVTRKLK
jgi:hypothetical protein